MINIVVFNWNYSRFLPKLLSEMRPIFNDPCFNIFFCDDGSTDCSLNVINKYISDGVGNIIVFKKCELNYGRQHPYLGQMESLATVMNSEYFSIFSHYWFMDADDYFDFSMVTQDFKRSIESSTVIFTKVKNIDRDGDVAFQEVIRPVASGSIIFPTISVTSSIIASGYFLKKYHEMIFKDGFDDLWLDARINMLACLLKSDEVLYVSDQHVCRLIHGGNDSINMPLQRLLKKQLIAHDYFRYIHGGKLFLHARMLMLSFISFISKAVNRNKRSNS